MRAAVLAEYGEPLEVQDDDDLESGPDGVVVEMEACGVCRSDWHAWTGDWDWVGAKPPRGQILGHEPAGRVVSDRITLDQVSDTLAEMGAFETHSIPVVTEFA